MPRKKKDNMTVLYKRVPKKLKVALTQLVDEYIKNNEH
jgi:hypothetical protein